MKPGTQPLTASRSSQLGAAAIEFAFLFMIFFLVMYGCISYGIVFLLQQGLTQAASEGARAGIVSLDRLQFATTPLYQAAGSTLATNATARALSWLPVSTRASIVTTTTWASTAIPVTTNIAAPSVINVSTPTLTVTVTYPYATAPILPRLTFWGITIPSVPAAGLVGQASL